MLWQRMLADALVLTVVCTGTGLTSRRFAAEVRPDSINSEMSISIHLGRMKREVIPKGIVCGWGFL